MSGSASVSATELLQRARSIHESIRTWRRTIHRYPELSFTEQRTAALVNSVLIDLGLQTETEVAKTGVVAHIRGGNGPTVALRADMDALPIQEVNGTEFDSTRPGIMHACGHDAHTAMLLGAATLLKQLADEGKLPGVVRLLFQPSEEAQDDEGKSGGMRMVEEGALEGVDAVFGLHVDPFHDVGSVATRPGPMMAAADMFEIVVIGSGGHAARPQSTIDPIALSAHVINAVHQIVSRRLDPTQPGVITIGTIQGGTANNIIPDRVTMTGTIRSFTPEVRTLLQDELMRAAGVVESLGGRAEVTIFPGYPPTVNDPAATEHMMGAMRELLGENHVTESELIMGAEDFSYMAQAAPGCFLRLGVHNPSWREYYPVHRADFRMDEDALPIGAAALALTALRWMEKRR
ncbi:MULTISPECIES: M20 metallopeptidase family protein [Caldilinea]|jgi:amidohydrolase|uniref:M20 metallopeptidase family protein n=1 Tax=Caldilinea TaxID=233191 RepID=UPI000305DD60|nr:MULTISPECIES: amidohydrolase [Caldilinea]MBO9391976.1 amidohydrolase [Caldilinea sp.]GIV73912.1 MAG: amidohydrolase [Caldilinea sp.]